MCVRYARQLTSFNIQGDAWSWWQNSAGRYQHGARPVEGSVLVFQRTGRLHYGHVSTVSKVIDRRTILVDHSWLEGDVLHRGMKVIDTSPNNTWTTVKVWYEPADHLGLRAYPTFGFIYPRDHKGFEQPLTVASNDRAAAQSDDDNERDGAQTVAPATPWNTVVRPAGRNAVAQPTAEPVAEPVRVATLFLPHRKPVPNSAPPAPPAATPVAVAQAPAEAVVAAYPPRRKPGSAEAQTPAAATPAQAGVEYTEVPQVAVPRHKPSGHGTSQQVADARGVSELSD